MRHQLNKLLIHNSTKAERQFAETLKKHHIRFRTKVKIDGHEVDFLVGKHAIEIDGHQQDVKKNLSFIHLGYTPMHLRNDEAKYETLALWLKEHYGRHIT